jgi:hypothetical protein
MHPRDVERLTEDEYTAFVRYMDEVARAAAKGRK